MKISGKIGAALIYALTRPLAVLPLGFHRANARFLAWVAGSLLKYRRDVVMTNLARSFPEKKYDELEEIAGRFYYTLCKVFCEAFWFGSKIHARRLKESHICEVTNPEMLNGYFREGKSMVVLASHSGNWELLGGMVKYLYSEDPLFDYKDMCVAYKALSNAAWDEFMKENRIAPVFDRTDFDGLVESFNVMRYIFKNRHKVKMYIFITDQSPYSRKSMLKVNDFMHQTTYSMEGAVSVAKSFSLPVLYLKMAEREGGYDITFRKICEDGSTMEMKDMLDSYYAMLEEDLNEQPWNYLWSHKRWKM